MSLRELLSQKKGAILRRWLDLIAGTHPAGVSPLTQEKDEFKNPEGHTVSQTVDTLYDELLQDRMNPDKVCESLGGILKIKAVQDISAGQAVSFVFLLKEAITEELADEIERQQFLRQWLEFESRIDMVASLAFEIYVQCREKICQLRVKEIKADREIAFRLLERVETAGRKRIEESE
jgi:hypothetical protein